LILSRASVSLEKSGGSDVQLETFILDFEDVFERYLRRVLEHRAPDGCSVKDGNDEGSRSLYDDRPEPPAQPDIVIERSGAPPLIVEVKYKDKPDRADVNQVVTYAACYRSKIVVLVHQTKAGAKASLKLRGVINGVSVYGYAFDLASEGLEAQETAFSAAVFNLVADDGVKVTA
jgi:5-methylcytosine-specific restriction enzyme subunit McrC